MELWDIYDKDRNFTGKVVPRGTTLELNEHRITVKLAIFNRDGEMLIQKRQLGKEKYPNYWDISASGDVIHEENSEEAIERIVFEELGLKHNFLNEMPIITSYSKNSFIDIYVLNLDIDINSFKIHPEEVQSVTWANKQEIIQLIEEEKFIPYNEGIIELLFFNKDCRGLINNGR